MQLIVDLECMIAQEQSPFRAQLLREDVARLRKLQAMAAAHDEASFLKAGMRIGWTQGEARTHELREALEPFLQAVYAGTHEPAQAARIVECWNELHRLRMERLLGCLSTPVPKPAG